MLHYGIRAVRTLGDLRVMGLFMCALVCLLVKLHSLKFLGFSMNLFCVFYRMAPRPPTPLQPSSEMNQIARAIEMMTNAIQQQNVAMAQNHQAAMHHWENARSAATASHVSLS